MWKFALIDVDARVYARALSAAFLLTCVGGCKTKEPNKPPDPIAESIGHENVRRDGGRRRRRADA